MKIRIGYCLVIIASVHGAAFTPVRRVHSEGDLTQVVMYGSSGSSSGISSAELPYDDRSKGFQPAARSPRTDVLAPVAQRLTRLVDRDPNDSQNLSTESHDADAPHVVNLFTPGNSPVGTSSMRLSSPTPPVDELDDLPGSADGEVPLTAQQVAHHLLLTFPDTGHSMRYLQTALEQNPTAHAFIAQHIAGDQQRSRLQSGTYRSLVVPAASPMTRNAGIMTSMGGTGGTDAVSVAQQILEPFVTAINAAATDAQQSQEAHAALQTEHTQVQANSRWKMIGAAFVSSALTAGVAMGWTVFAAWANTHF